MQQSQRDELRIHAGVAYVCANLSDMYDLISAGAVNVTAPLENLLNAVRGEDRAAVPPALEALHAALQQAGDARAIFGNLRGFAVPGVRPSEIVYRCPLQRCRGRRGEDVGADLPHCAIDNGRELVRDTK